MQRTTHIIESCRIGGLSNVGENALSKMGEDALHSVFLPVNGDPSSPYLGVRNWSLYFSIQNVSLFFLKCHRSSLISPRRDDADVASMSLEIC